MARIRVRVRGWVRVRVRVSSLDLVRQELEVPADGAVARASLDAFGAARGHGGPGTADVWFLGEVGKLSQLGHPT